MKKGKLLLIVGLVCVLVLVAAFSLKRLLGDRQNDSSADQTASGETTEIDYSAPDFTVYDADGVPYQLSDFEGKPVILNFWASWCPPCKAEMPDLQAAFETYGNEIQFVMVNLTDGTRETVDTALSFLQEQGYTFPVYYDTDMDAAMTYGVSSIPQTYFIDEAGELIAGHTGMLDAELLQQGIDLIHTP